MADRELFASDTIRFFDEARVSYSPLMDRLCNPDRPYSPLLALLTIPQQFPQNDNRPVVVCGQLRPTALEQERRAREEAEAVALSAIQWASGLQQQLTAERQAHQETQALAQQWWEQATEAKAMREVSFLCERCGEEVNR